MNFIDLFAGAGGLSEGFIQTGFNPVAHIEMKTEACFTLKTRLSYHFLKRQDKLSIYESYLKGELNRDELYSYIPKELLSTVHNVAISAQNINDIFLKIDSQIEYLKTTTGIQDQPIDIIVGGPPCQAYSLIGRHKINWENDDRLHLFVLYGEFLKKYDPKVFVFENVPGILSAKKGLYIKNLREYYDQLGYNVEFKVLNSENFGVIQKRRRVIIIGWKKDLNFEYPNFELLENGNSIADIFCDLPTLTPGESVNVGKYTAPPSEYLISSGIRTENNNFFTQHISRGHNENDLKIYKMAQDKWINEHERLKYNDIPKEWRTQNNLKSFLDRFKVVDPYGCSHTIVAHIAKDGHYYIHPFEVRSISIREAARIQSFSDNFFFEGSRTAIFTQIGNAVPPLMAQKIAFEIRNKLEN